MSYKIFLIDEINYVEVEPETLDISTVFSVADISDLAKRKDSVTKQVNFKGTKVNNSAFGSLFHLNKVTNSNLQNRLFFNYNPLRTVDCLVMEDAMLLFKGSMRVTEINVDKNSQITYSTVITGKIIEFNSIIQNKLLTDLDFQDLKHRYSIHNIMQSWSVTTERFDKTSNNFYDAAFQKGSGYVYPLIDYGFPFQETAANTDVNRVQVLNFKPAIYVKEYFNKIFAQPELAGFTYEVKGDSDFQEKFNSLIIPNSDEKLTYKLSGFFEKFTNSSPENSNQQNINFDDNAGGRLLPIPVFTPPPSNITSPYISHFGSYKNVLTVNKTVTTDAYVKVHFSYIVNSYNDAANFRVVLMERDPKNNDNSFDGWSSVAQQEIHLNGSQELYGKTFEFFVPERTYQQNKQLAVAVRYEIATFMPVVAWNATTTEVRFPKDEFTQIQLDLQVDYNDTDVITPMPPANIKQFDFIKSLMNLFNFYVYYDSKNEKHIIFEKYDDYYGLTSPLYIKNTALDWTDKIDYSKSWKIKPNLTIPKNYLFTYKDDSDYANAEYKRKYGEVFGSFSFNDEYGVTEQKKVELIFSPTPTVQYGNSTRLMPALYTIESGTKKSMKTNIRILYYNGVKAATPFTIARDNFINNSWTTETMGIVTSYPFASSYYVKDSKVIEDLNFGRPKEFYFPVTADYINASTAYSNYYITQVSELTNLNTQFIECEAVLNEIDIANLDLKVPVFIDINEFGHAYFKVLNVEYVNNNTVARIQLQKIYFGTDRKYTLLD